MVENYDADPPVQTAGSTADGNAFPDDTEADPGDRPDYIHCIAHTHADKKRTTYCGRKIESFEWVFNGIDHAANTRMNKDSLLVCPQCRDAVAKLLESDD